MPTPLQDRWIQDIWPEAGKFFQLSGAEPSGVASAQAEGAPVSRLDDPGDLAITVVAFTLSPPDGEIPDEGQVAFKATADYGDGTSRDITLDVTWGSSNPAIEIDASGMARAHRTTASGEITATHLASGRTATASVHVGPPNAGPAVRQITVTPANPALVGALGFGAAPKTQPFKAIGLFADGKSRDITARVLWRSSSPEILSVDTAGVASTGSRSGTATVYATDPDSAALGAAVGGSTTVSVTIPEVTSVVINPTSATIDLDESRQLTAKVSFSTGAHLEGRDVVLWSVSGGALSVSASGLIQAMAAGTVHVTAARGEKSASVDIAVQDEIVQHTGFGTFNYYVRNQGSVYPALRAVLSDYDDTIGLVWETGEASKALAYADKELGSLQDILSDIKQNTPEGSQRDAAISTEMRKMKFVIVGQMRIVHDDLKQAAVDLTVDSQEIAALANQQAAYELQAEAAALAKRTNATIEALGGFIEAFAAAESGGLTALIKPAWDVFGAFYKQYRPEQAELSAKADEFMRRAMALKWSAAISNFSAAVARFTAAAEAIPALQKAADQAKTDYDTEIGTTNRRYDETTPGKFHFAALQAAISLSEKAINIADRTEFASGLTRDAANELSKMIEQTYDLVPRPDYARALMSDFVKAATKMSNNATASRKGSKAIRDRLQATMEAAQQARFEAPGTGMPVSKH